MRNTLIFLKEKQLLNSSFLEIIGRRYSSAEVEEDEISFPISKSIAQSIMNDEIWPCEGNLYSSLENIYIIKDDLKKKRNFNEIFSQSNLKILLNKKKLYHLIKGNENFEKLAIHYGITKIDQNKIIDEIEKNNFIQIFKIVKNKSNPWLIKLYLLLHDFKFQNHEFPLIKADDNKFYKGQYLRFKTNLDFSKINTDILKVPQNKASITVGMRDNKWKYSLFINCIGKTNVFGADVAPYSYTDLSVHYDVNLKSNLFVKFHDLFDKKYETVPGYTEGGRSIFAGFKYKY